MLLEFRHMKEVLRVEWFSNDEVKDIKKVIQEASMRQIQTLSFKVEIP